MVRGCACCVVSGGQKYVQRTSAFLNHSALTFKAVTKLRRDSVSPWRHTFLNSADSGRRFCLYLQKQVAHKTCAHRKFRPNELRNWPIQWNFFQGTPIINTSLQKGCTSYYMPEISKNEIDILKSNRGKKLIRIDSLHEDVQWLEFLTYYRPSCYMDSSTKTIFMRCMKALNMIVFFLGCSWICTIQYNKSLFSCSFIIFLMPTWIENMV